MAGDVEDDDDSQVFERTRQRVEGGDVLSFESRVGSGESRCARRCPFDQPAAE